MSEGRWAPMRRLCACLARLRKRRRRRGGPDVTCETLAGVEPGNSVTFKGQSWRKKRPPGRLRAAVTRLRDAYVGLMVQAADHPGDMSTLVYGNAYSGTEFQFGSVVAADEDAAVAAGSLSRRSSNCTR